MSLSQLFYQPSQNLSQKRTQQSQVPLTSVKYNSIPEAPVANEAPVVSSDFQGLFDFQPSQLFQSEPKNTLKKNQDQIHNLFNQNNHLSSRKIVPVSRVEKIGTVSPLRRNDDLGTGDGSDDDLFEPSHDTTPLISVKDQVFTPAPLILPTPSCHGIQLRSVQEIPEKYRGIFKSFPYFNIVQSKVFDDVFYTDKPLVVCAPTGAGKTVVFELSILRIIMKLERTMTRSFKIVYMAPVKALCSERFQDWKEKFEPFGLKCKELTGDTEVDDYYELQEVNIILTTPEKWDSMTRRWRDNTCIVQSVCLFLIDEIHVLNDNVRGATMEAVISRMKTVQASMSRSNMENSLPKLRLIAASATIPNIEDIAEWMGDNSHAAAFYKMDDSYRPVRLRKVVLGFPFDEQKGSGFHFDMSLSYKLAGIISTYADGKPTLVFCSTRKSTQQAAEILARDSRGTYIKDTKNRQMLLKYSNLVRDAKVRDTLVKGIGIHHAGMDLQDRKHIEELFATSQLQVLVATSTLAMGVNLPAHLVILKSTQHYSMGMLEEYSNTQVLQMIGRAGRPQFDTTATAVIMTKIQNKMKYESLLNGTQMIESSLHKHLIEHLNAEIVLKTISDMSIAMEWIRYTYLYIRVMKNPKHYGMPVGLTREQTETKLQELCMRNLNQLAGIQMISMNGETFDIQPTEAGRLMARYCIAFETMKKFCSVSGEEGISELLEIVSGSEEFMEIQLRVNEKKTLNTLNKDKNRQTIRYQLPGKIKTKQMKVNCLIQAQLGCLLVQDFALQQDTTRIFRAAQRLSRCLMEVLWIRSDYLAFLSAVQLYKAIRSKLWENSKHVAKQLERIGPALSTALVNAGITSFQKIEETNPRELELIVNRHPPFGNQVRDSVARLPKYELTMEQVSRYNSETAEILIHLNIANKDKLLEKTTASPMHTSILLVADTDNKIIFRRRLMDSFLLKDAGFTKKLEVKRAATGSQLHIHFISQDWVGLDVQTTYSPFYLGATRISNATPQVEIGKRQQNPAERSGGGISSTGLRPCNHKCFDKSLCGHKCCLSMTKKKLLPPPTPKTPAVPKTKAGDINSYMSGLKNKLSMLPDTPSAKRIKVNTNHKSPISMDKFAYKPRKDIYNTTERNESFKQQYCNEVSEHCNQLEGAPTSQYTRSEGLGEIKRLSNKPSESAWSSTQKLYKASNQSSDGTGENKSSKELTKQQFSEWAQLDFYQQQREQYMEEQEQFYQENDYDLPDISITDSFSPRKPKEREFCQLQEEYGNFSVTSSLFPSRIPSPHRISYKTQTRVNGTLSYSSDYDDDDFVNSVGFQQWQGNKSNCAQRESAVNKMDRNISYRTPKKGLSDDYSQGMAPFTAKMPQKGFSYNMNEAKASAVSGNYVRTKMCPEDDAGHYDDVIVISEEEPSPNESYYSHPSGKSNLYSQHTGHRFGQVVAWSNSQKTYGKVCPDTPGNEEDQWSGSDNDLLVVDTSPVNDAVYPKAANEFKQNETNQLSISQTDESESLCKLVRPQPRNISKNGHNSRWDAITRMEVNNLSTNENLKNYQERKTQFCQPVNSSEVFKFKKAVEPKISPTSASKPASFFTTEELPSTDSPGETFSSIFDGIF